MDRLGKARPLRLMLWMFGLATVGMIGRTVFAGPPPRATVAHLAPSHDGRTGDDLWEWVTVGSAKTFQKQSGPRHHAAEELLPEEGDGPKVLQPSVASSLLRPERSAPRGEQLERIAHQADAQIRRGFELAGRKAHFAARAEFIRALRLVAQGLDTEKQTAVHSRTLAAGLTAIKEAEDFIPDGSRLEADLDVPSILANHRTPVLKGAEAESLTPLSALKCYFTFAQEQLATAAGGEIAGSMALRGLGKVHAALADQKRGNVRAAIPKAMAFYQAALLVYPRNHMAANDLGVLLARGENYQQALGVLAYSVSVHRQSSNLHNLAVVYQRLGQIERARQAQQRSLAARRAKASGAGKRQDGSHELVRWVDPQSFAQSHVNASSSQPLMSSWPRPTQTEKPSQPVSAAKKTWPSGWWPWKQTDNRK